MPAASSFLPPPSGTRADGRSRVGALAVSAEAGHAMVADEDLVVVRAAAVPVFVVDGVEEVPELVENELDLAPIHVVDVRRGAEEEVARRDAELALAALALPAGQPPAASPGDEDLR